MRAIFKPLAGPRVTLRPAEFTDLEPLFELGKDPEVWALHRFKDRGTRECFLQFFLSGFQNPLGIYTIVNSISGCILGTTRYYAYVSAEKAVHIGYTFLGKQYWGTGMNAEVKGLMLDNAFNMVEHVYFDVFEANIRSHKAVLKLGAVLDEIRGDRYVYKIDKYLWKGFEPLLEVCEQG